MELIGIVGCGGLGRDVMPIARAVAQRMRPGASAEAVFVVEYGPLGERINGHRVISSSEFEAAARQHRCAFNVAISNSAARQRIAERLLDAGAEPLALQGEPVVILDGAQLGSAALLCAYTFVGANATIGRFFHGNIYSQVEHDCRIGDYVTFGPGVRCNGNILIEDHAYVGSGALIRQGSAERPLVIGRGAVIGMGAVVLNDVPPGATVVGNPARPIRGA
ncbi:MAG TPA: acetyltransferase [Burkholderiaceae bacterium]|jgi:sugar O-acyltransferase (sialic acid O-acetyltransferase NeuD family)|nr:acetyltransferase [Burkholderiaceae bacterium]